MEPIEILHDVVPLQLPVPGGQPVLEFLAEHQGEEKGEEKGLAGEERRVYNRFEGTFGKPPRCNESRP